MESMISTLELMTKVKDYLKLVGKSPTSDIEKHFRYVTKWHDPSWTRKFLHRAEKQGFVKCVGTDCLNGKNFVGGSEECQWEAAK